MTKSQVLYNHQSEPKKMPFLLILEYYLRYLFHKISLETMELLNIQMLHIKSKMKSKMKVNLKHFS